MFTDKTCGLDVLKDSVFTCILDREGKINFGGRFGTLTPELDRLQQTLVEYDVGRLAMESTSIYWMPIWRVLDGSQATCLTLLEELAMKHFAEEISLLQTITGIGRMNAIYILAEIGGDMSVFHNAVSFVGWAGLRPRKFKNVFFHVKYQNLCDRKSAQKAILAIARKMLVVIYNVLTRKEAFDPTRNLPAAQHEASRLAAKRKVEKLSAQNGAAS